MSTQNTTPITPNDPQPTVEQMVEANINPPMTAPETLTVEDIMAEISPPAEPEPAADPNDPYAGLSREELAAKLQDTEQKRRGFQAENDATKARLAQIEGALRYNQNPVQGNAQVKPPEPKQTKPPTPDDFLKGVDPDDSTAVLTAQAKYFEAKQAYDFSTMKKQLRAEIAQEAEQQKVLAQSRTLAAKDPAFRLPNGEPNLHAISEFLDRATSDWSSLYDAVNSPPPAPAAPAVPVAPEPSATPAQQLAQLNAGFPKTLSGASSAAAPPSTSKLPPQLRDMISHATTNFELPHGAIIKK